MKILAAILWIVLGVTISAVLDIGSFVKAPAFYYFLGYLVGVCSMAILYHKEATHDDQTP